MSLLVGGYSQNNYYRKPANNINSLPQSSNYSSNSSGNVMGIKTSQSDSPSYTGISRGSNYNANYENRQYGTETGGVQENRGGDSDIKSLLRRMGDESPTARNMLERAQKMGVSIEFVGNNRDQWGGYNSGKYIQIENQGSDAANISVIAHELGHALTTSNGNSMSEEYGNQLLGQKVIQEMGYKPFMNENQIYSQISGAYREQNDNGYFEQMKAMGIDVLQGRKNPFADGRSHNANPNDPGMTGNGGGLPGGGPTGGGGGGAGPVGGDSSGGGCGPTGGGFTPGGGGNVGGGGNCGGNNPIGGTSGSNPTDSTTPSGSDDTANNADGSNSAGSANKPPATMLEALMQMLQKMMEMLQKMENGENPDNTNGDQVQNSSKNNTPAQGTQTKFAQTPAGQNTAKVANNPLQPQSAGNNIQDSKQNLIQSMLQVMQKILQVMSGTNTLSSQSS